MQQGQLKPSDLYNPTKSSTYSFFDNLRRLIGISDSKTNVKQPWYNNKGQTYYFTEMSDSDIRNQADREIEGTYESDRVLRHWKKLPFSFSTKNDGSKNSWTQHTGYFVVPAWSNSLPNDKDRSFVIESMVLDDGTKMDYKTAQKFFNTLQNSNRVSNLSIGKQTEAMKGTEINPKAESFENYGSTYQAVTEQPKTETTGSSISSNGASRVLDPLQVSMFTHNLRNMKK